MKTKLTLQQLCRLGSDELGWACIAPQIQEVRGKDAALQAKIYEQLTQGQQAVFMFYAFHLHTETIEEYYYYSSYYVGELDVWSKLLKGIELLKDDRMYSILEQLEQIVEEHCRQTDGNWRSGVIADLARNEALLLALKSSYRDYREASLQTIDGINGYVAEHLAEFVEVI